MRKILVALLCLSMMGSTWGNPIPTVMGYGPGTLDRTIRLMIADVESHSNLRFIPQNITGANGVIALRQYFSSDQKENSILGITAGQVLYEALVNPKNNYLDRIRIIGPVVVSPLSIAAGPKSDISNIRFLFDRSQPSKVINIGSAGESHDMLINLMAQHSHHNIASVRFKGSDDAFAALMGGHIDLQVSVYGDFKSKGSSVRVLSVAQKNHVDGVPGLQQYVPTAELVNFFAIAIDKQQTNYQTLADALTKATSAPGSRILQLQTQGYQIDLNKNNDYMERKVLPVYKQWNKK